MESRLHEFKDFTRRYVVFAGGAAGVVLLGVGVAVHPTSGAGTVFVGLGVGLLAAFILALLSWNREDLLESLFRQGVIEVFPSRLDRTKDRYWTELLRGVNREYRVLGVANHGYTGTTPKQDLYSGLICSALERGVHVEFIWLNPTCPAADLREDEEGRATRKDIVSSILWFWSLREGLDQEPKERCVLKEHTHMPSCGITHADDRLTVTHYVPGQDNLDSPGWILTESAYPFYRRVLAFLGPTWARTELVEVYLNTYREVVGKATTIDAERIEVLKAKLPAYEVGKPSEADRRQERYPEEES